MNQAIEDMAISVYEATKERTRRSYEPIKALLREYGLPDEILEKYEERKLQEQEEKRRTEEEAAERQRQIEEQLQKDQESASELHRSSSQRPSNSLALVSNRSSSKQDDYDSNNNNQLVPYTRGPRTDFGQKAQVEIERIKRGKEQREAKVKSGRVLAGVEETGRGTAAKEGGTRDEGSQAKSAAPQP